MNKKLKTFLIILSTCTLGGQLQAQDTSSKDIVKKLETMQAEIAELKNKLKSQGQDSKATEKELEEDLFKPQAQAIATSQPKVTPTSASPQDLGQFGITYRSDGYKLDALRFGAYGESIFGGTNSGDGWESGFDAKKFVLLGTYQISDNIFFNTEIEFEHGGLALDEDDKLGGAVEIEQVFIDFRTNDYFTWRSPGVDVVPVGYINLFHEPTQFYSTKKPEIYDGLIPSTWVAPSTGAYGKIIDGLNYQVQVSSSLEDTIETDSSGEEYEAGISGTEALSIARAPIADKSRQVDNLAYTARLSYSPTVIPGLSGSTSFYYTNDTTPRNAFGTNANGSRRSLGSSSLALFDTELRYRIPETGIEFRSEYARVDFGNTNNLRANNDGDTENNVGDYMDGYSLEVAFHHDLNPNEKDTWELVPFYRFSSIDLQNSGVGGTDANNPTGSGSRRYHTFGAALFPTPKVVLKADYQIVADDDSQSSDTKSFLGAVGFFF